MRGKGGEHTTLGSRKREGRLRERRRPRDGPHMKTRGPQEEGGLHTVAIPSRSLSLTPASSRLHSLRIPSSHALSVALALPHSLAPVARVHSFSHSRLLACTRYGSQLRVSSSLLRSLSLALVARIPSRRARYPLLAPVACPVFTFPVTRARCSRLQPYIRISCSLSRPHLFRVFLLCSLFVALALLLACACRSCSRSRFLARVPYPLRLRSLPRARLFTITYRVCLC